MKKWKAVLFVMSGIVIGAMVASFWIMQIMAAATNFDRLVLGSANYGEDPSTTSDIVLQNDETITNYTDGTIGFGSATVSTTGDVTAGTSLTLGAQAHKEYVTKVTLTTAQVLALYTTPISLVATPGANKAIIFLDALILVDYVSAAYDGVDAAEDLIISYTDGSGEVVAEIETTGFIDQATDQLRYVTPSAGADGANNAYIVPVSNAAMVISLLAGNIATGNSPIDIVIHYKVVATDL